MIIPNRKFSTNSDPNETTEDARPPKIAAIEEAPDTGLREEEAPEDHVTRRAEAADAGEGRAARLESEYTRGRSNS